MICPPSVFAYNAPCSPARGGIKAIYVANPDNVKLAMTQSSGQYTGAAVLTPVTIGAKPFYKWDVAPNGSTLQAQAQINEANNVRYFSVDLAAALNGFKPTSAGADLLAKLTRLAVVAEMHDGTRLFLGIADATYSTTAAITRGADITGFEWTPGQADGDAVRATVTAHLDTPVFLPDVGSSIDNLIFS